MITCLAVCLGIKVSIGPGTDCFAGTIQATPDTDGDMLLDAYETGSGVFVSDMNTGSSPTDFDSDDDGTPDGLEISKGLDPNDPLSRLDRPNIIFILADDLGYGDLGCFHQDAKSGNKFDTPEIDLMAAQGMKLTHHYVSSPVCAPSRASFLSGRHQGHANVRDTQFDKALEDNHTMARMLQSAGYFTAHLGKYGLAGLKSDPTLPGHPNLRGFDYFLGYLFHIHGHEHYPQNGGTGKNAFVYENDQKITNAYLDVYTTDLWTARAKQLIMEETATHPDRPFFLYLGYDAPHQAMQYPPVEYPAGRGISGGLQWVGGPAYCNTASNDVASIDSWIHPDFASKGWPNNNTRHAAMIRRIDEGVGDLLQTLIDLEIDDNTLVVFSSDNGPHFESHNPRFFESYGKMDGIKRDLWEAGIRVPTIAWWPSNVVAGTESAFPSGNWDWMPTFADLAAVPPPARCDGVSLIPTLTQTGEQRDQGYLYFEFKHQGATPDFIEFEPSRRGRVRGEMQAIRIGDFSGVRTSVTSFKDPLEIYNVVVDPKQITNLSGTAPFFDSLQRTMQNLTMQARRPAEDIVRPYDSENIPPIGAPVLPGLSYAVYEGLWAWLPEFDLLSPVSTGTVANIDLSVRTRDDDIGIAFLGYIDIPADGPYTFYLMADTAASLWIHDSNLIDNDFGYEATEVNATINLGAGLHPITLYYRHTIGSHVLEFEYSGASLTRQPVPASVLFRIGPFGPNPVANDDAANTFQNSPVLIDVMANDYDDGGLENLSIHAIGSPFGGAVSNIHGRLQYTPDSDFLGADHFEYGITDGSSTATGEVHIFIFYESPDDLWISLNEVEGYIAHEAGGRPLGTLTGFPDSTSHWVEGRFGKAVLFNGATSSILLDPSYEPPSGSVDRSMTAWIKATDSGSIAAWGNEFDTRKWYWRLGDSGVDDGVLRIEVQGGHLRGTQDLRDDQWHHVAVTFGNDGSPDVIDCILYVDGMVETIGGSVSQLVATDLTPVQIGTAGANRFFGGIIDEIRIYNRSLSAAEILDDFASIHLASLAWHRRYFGPDPVQWALDLDNDQLLRLGEYAFGGNPRIPEIGALGLRPFLNQSTGNPAATYNRRIAGTHDLLYSGEAAGNLADWGTLTVIETDSVPHTTLLGFEQVTVETDVQPTGPSNQFIRVKVGFQP